MLCRTPTRISKTLDTVPGYDADKNDMGITSTPEGTVPPVLNLKVFTEAGNAWKVKCVLTPAEEGTNGAIYLGAGTYPTGKAWYPESNGFGPSDRAHSEIYGVVDATNSNRSRIAEVEHCNDWIRAHELTLKAAENTIRYAASGLENRRFNSRADAYAGSLEAFVAHSSHVRIASGFRESIVATDTRQDFFPRKFKEKLDSLFMDVGLQTSQRDSNYWHHFEIGPAVPDNELGVIDRLGGRGRDYRRIQPSASFTAGHPQLVHL